MISIGIHPSLRNLPFMLERMARAHNLQRVEGNHVHLVSASMVNPQAVKPRKTIVRSNYDWTPGGNAA